MPTPLTPQNIVVQQGNGSVLLTWNLSAGATVYPITRSTDNITFSAVASPAVTSYVDTTVTKGIQYYYKVAASDGVNTSAPSQAITVIPVESGNMSLLEIRTQAQQRADRQFSNFVGVQEWNTYINQSWFELYDILITVYEDYFVKEPVLFITNGSDQSYPLAPDFYKMYGVDYGLNTNQNAWVTLEKFNFISRNQFVYPQLNTTIIGPFNLKYRVLQDKIHFIPIPSGGQYVRYWYIPKPVTLLLDSDILPGQSGWSEYVIVDAAIKALSKEESDVSVLMAQKMALKDRIEKSAMNRDVGQPDKISDTRSSRSRWGDTGFSGGFGGGY